MSKNPTPSRAKLIALLIEERAKYLSRLRGTSFFVDGVIVCPVLDSERDQARREIEAEVLKPTNHHGVRHDYENIQPKS